MSVDSKESNCTMKEELVQGPSSTCDSVALGGATFSSERRGLVASSVVPFYPPPGNPPMEPFLLLGDKSPL